MELLDISYALRRDFDCTDIRGAECSNAMRGWLRIGEQTRSFLSLHPEMNVCMGI